MGNSDLVGSFSIESRPTEAHLRAEPTLRRLTSETGSKFTISVEKSVNFRRTNAARLFILLLLLLFRFSLNPAVARG